MHQDQNHRDQVRIPSSRLHCEVIICRVGIYYQLVRYMKEHFGDDAKGRKKAFYFLPWHFNFFCRYRCCPKLSSLWAFVWLWPSMVQAVDHAL